MYVSFRDTQTSLPELCLFVKYALSKIKKHKGGQQTNK